MTAHGVTTSSFRSAASHAPRPIVVKIGGTGVEDASSAGPLWVVLARLHDAEPGGVIVVHGGGKAVDAHLERLGIRSERVEGLRVTSAEQIGEIVAVLAGRINVSIVGALIAAGVPAVGLTLGDGRTAIAGRAPARAGVDLGFVGEVDGGDPALLRTLLARRFLPVVSPIAFDRLGQALNINADDAAAALAAITGARLLVLLTDVPGIRGASGTVLPVVLADDVETMIRAGVIHGGMIPKARAAVAAATRTGIETLIASWDDPNRLVGLARGESCGTRVRPQPAGAPASR